MDLDDLDLDELCAGITQGEFIKDSMTMAMDSLREPSTPSTKDLPCTAESMVFDLGISTLTLSPDVFDRLVVRHMSTGGTLSVAMLSFRDKRLYELGLVEITDDSGDTYNFMGEIQTTMTSYTVSLTHVGLVVLKLAGPVAIANSLIRQGFFASLEKLMKQFKRKWLPEFLSHKALRVRALAAKRLDQLDKKED